MSGFGFRRKPMYEKDFWESYLTAWLDLKSSDLAKRDIRPYWSQMQKILKAAKKRLSKLNTFDIHWLEAALQNNDHKWFVLDVFSKLPPAKFYRQRGYEQGAGWPKIPEGLFAAFIRADVYERNPSNNRFFIEPCLDSFSCRRVNEALLDYLEKGTNEEKAGAANAMYWAGHDLNNDDMADIRSRRRNLLLKEFVTNEDLWVRKSVLSGLPLDPELYPDELKPLIPQAIEIGRNHKDYYIRSRIEIQLGGSGIPQKHFPDDPP